MPFPLPHLLLLLALLLLPMEARSVPAELHSPLPPLPETLQKEKDLLMDYASVALREILPPGEPSESEKDGEILMGILRRHPQAVSALRRLVRLRWERQEESLLLQELRELNQGENPPWEARYALWDLLFFFQDPEAAPFLETMKKEAPLDPQVLRRAIFFYHETGQEKARDQAIQQARNLPECGQDLPLHCLLLRIAGQIRDSALAEETARRIAENQDFLNADFFEEEYQEAWDILWEARMFVPLALLLQPMLPLFWETSGTEAPSDLCQLLCFIALKAQDYTGLEKILQFLEKQMSPSQWHALLPDVLDVFRQVEEEDFQPRREIPPQPFLKLQADLLERYVDSLPLLRRKDNLLRLLARLALGLDDPPRLIRALCQLPNPNLQDSLLLLEALFAHGDLDAARREMRNIQQRFPGTLKADFYLQQAYLEEMAGELEAAIQAIQKVMTLTPDDPEAANFLGYLYADHNIHLDQAEPLIQKALAADPQNPAYLDSLAWLRFRQGRTEEALALMAQALHAFSQSQAQPPLTSEMSQELLAHLREILQALGAAQLARYLSFP